MFVHMYMCAGTVLSICVWACTLTCLLVFVHVCVCVCVCARALCACVKREENPDCLEISQNPEHASCQALVTAVAHRTEPLGKVSGHLGKGEEK